MEKEYKTPSLMSYNPSASSLAKLALGMAISGVGEAINLAGEGVEWFGDLIGGAGSHISEYVHDNEEIFVGERMKNLHIYRNELNRLSEAVQSQRDNEPIYPSLSKIVRAYKVYNLADAGRIAGIPSERISDELTNLVGEDEFSNAPNIAYDNSWNMAHRENVSYDEAWDEAHKEN